MNWIVENYLIVLGIVGGLLVAARYAVKLTKSTKDDEIVAAVESAFEKVEDLVTKKDAK